MVSPDPERPLTRPSLRYFVPYRQTIVGFLVVTVLVALLIISVQLLVGV